jgi:hypothetical protein
MLFVPGDELFAVLSFENMPPIPVIFCFIGM